MSDEHKEQSPPKKKLPFKLCFAPRNLFGRSNIQIGKPLTMPSAIVTPKFYSNDEIKPSFSESDIKRQMQYLEVTGPREKFNDPVTENQRYGWYQVRFTDLDRSDKRLHFAKHTNPLVKEHLMNYENIR